VFGQKQFTGVGYPTPVSIPEDTSCLILQIPADEEWWGVVVGLLYSLILEWNWQQFEGGLDRDVVAARWQQMLEEALAVAEASSDCALAVRAPYWDDGSDVGLEADAEAQPWYGYVTDPTAAPGELTFVEDATIWVLTGMLAIGATPAAAILFQTIAPRFALAMRGGDVVEIIRVLLDGEEMARIETSGDPDELIEIPIVGDPEISLHDLMIILQQVVT